MAGEKEVVGEVMLRNVRLSFAQNLYKRGDDRVNDDGETVPGSFSCSFLMKKGDPEGERNKTLIQKAAREAKVKKWGPDESKWPKLKPEKVCLRDGDLESWDGYEGMWYLSANSDRQPQVITNRRDAEKRWIPANPGQALAPYSGCYVNALVRLWAQDNKHGKRINASLEVVQFYKDGEAFGAAPVDPNEKFTDDMIGEEGSIGDDDLI